MYHSALRNFKEWKGEPSSSFLSQHIKAFQHDLFDGLHPSFNSCDFFYADLPWKHGYQVFNDRIGYQTDRTWEDLLMITYREIKKSGKPTYLTGGKQMAKVFPTGKMKEITFNIHNMKSYLIVFNTDELPLANDTDSLFSELYGKYDIGGDFVCGYGQLAHYAIKHNKTAILSDYNPYCIGYIKAHYENL